ncbi:MAG: hypothetical protein GX490_02790 [Bacilli bacterium]|nr:hypothetical protein [Bacilli bacterium]
MINVKETLAKTKLALNKGMKWVLKHKRLALLFMVVVIIAIYGLNALFSFKLKADASYQKPGSQKLADAIEVIENNIVGNYEEVLVFENETKAMYVEKSTTNVRILDKETGVSWNTLALDTINYKNLKPQPGSDKVNISESMQKYVNPFSINIIAKDNSQTRQEAYKNSIQDRDFTIEKIANGVRLTYNLRDKTLQTFEIFPKKITVESFEKNIKSKLDAAFENGDVTEFYYKEFLENWPYYYDMMTDDKGRKIYVYKLVSLPTVDKLNVFRHVFDKIGYTQDQLIEDNLENGELTYISKKANFKVIMELTLDGDDFLIRIPTEYLKSDSATYDITAISIFPYFGQSTANKYNKDNPGYMFIPDGAGALVKLNSQEVNYSTYTKAIYNNGIYKTYYQKPTPQEDINMPVYGYYGNYNTYMQGYFAIIEDGAETAYINVQPTTVSETASMNALYPQFDLMQLASVKLFGYYSTNTTSYLSRTPRFNQEVNVRYKLIVDEKIDYYDFVEIYRDYLIDKLNLVASYDEFKPKVFLDLVGSVNIQHHFLGVPYDTHISMTTYKEAQKILEQLDGNLVVSYLGAINKGINQSLLTEIEFAKENGTYGEYKNLEQYLTNRDSELFVKLRFLNVAHNKTNGFNMKKNAVYGFDSQPITKYTFNVATGRFNFLSTANNQLSPIFLTDVVNHFIKNNNYFDNISLSDLGSTYLVDYNKNNHISPYEGKYYEEKNLTTLSQYNLMLNDPYINNIQYARYVENISRESTNYYLLTVNVPFKQLVMNGFVEYISLNANLNTEKPMEYFLLQAIELGQHPKFTLSYKNPSLLKDSEFNYFYSVYYKNWIDDINEMANAYEAAFEQIGTNQIINHEILANNVYKTTYSTGVSVIVNYNNISMVVGEQTLEPLSYLIIAEEVGE